jgi:hypothetical protein
MGLIKVKEGSISFLKKRNKKLLLLVRAAKLPIGST